MTDDRNCHAVLHRLGALWDMGPPDAEPGSAEALQWKRDLLMCAIACQHWAGTPFASAYADELFQRHALTRK
jgi:hypothetical protein